MDEDNGLPDPSPVLQFRNGHIKVDEIKLSLRVLGYAVIKDVVPKKRCDAIAKKFWEYAKECQPGWSPTNDESWEDANRPPNDRGGLNHFNAAQHENCDMARDAVKPLFDLYFGTNEIVCSFEGPIVNRYPVRPAIFKDVEAWKKETWDDGLGWKLDTLKIEQSDVKFSMHQICSVTALVDETADGQVFTCIPGSHHKYSKIMAATPTPRPKRIRGPARLDQAQFNYIKKPKNNFKMVRVPLEAGDVIMYLPTLVYGQGAFCKTAREGQIQLQERSAWDTVESIHLRKQMKLREQAWAKGRASGSCVRVFRSVAKAAIFGKKLELLKSPPIFELDERRQKYCGIIPHNPLQLIKDEDRMASGKNPKRSADAPASSSSSPKKKHKKSKNESDNESSSGEDERVKRDRKKKEEKAKEEAKHKEKAKKREEERMKAEFKAKKEEKEREEAEEKAKRDRKDKERKEKKKGNSKKKKESDSESSSEDSDSEPEEKKKEPPPKDKDAKRAAKRAKKDAKRAAKKAAKEAKRAAKEDKKKAEAPVAVNEVIDSKGRSEYTVVKIEPAKEEKSKKRDHKDKDEHKKDKKKHKHQKEDKDKKEPSMDELLAGVTSVKVGEVTLKPIDKEAVDKAFAQYQKAIGPPASEVITAVVEHALAAAAASAAPPPLPPVPHPSSVPSSHSTPVRNGGTSTVSTPTSTVHQQSKEDNGFDVAVDDPLPF